MWHDTYQMVQFDRGPCFWDQLPYDSGCECQSLGWSCVGSGRCGDWRRDEFRAKPPADEGCSRTAAEEFSREKQRRSADRRFEAYADFLTKARIFRNAIRRYGDNSDPEFTPAAVDAIARSAHAASALVFLVMESPKTDDVVRAIVATMSEAQGFLRDFGPSSTDDPWLELNNKMARLLREFQAAAREELEIGVLDRAQILRREPRNDPHSPPSS